MKRGFLPSNLVALIVCLVMLILSSPASATTVRKAAYAGMFYPASGKELSRAITGFTKTVDASRVQIPRNRKLKALIMPHAGYVYSGQTAAYASRVIAGHRFSKVIVMGPDHRVGFSGASVSTADAYETPLGAIRLHPDAARLRKQGGLFRTVKAADDSEHSIEVVLPFLQTYLGSFTLVPIIMGPGDIKAYTKAISTVVDDETLLVASSDMSHFLPKDRAEALDEQTISMITSLNAEGLASGDNRACGIIPIQVILACARSGGWEARLLHYATSCDATGDSSRVVGYATIAFFGGETMGEHYSEEQGRALVALARRTIKDKLGLAVPPDPKLDRALGDEALKTKAGTFVTLTIGKELRGCIGSLEARESLVDGVKHNAVNAAFRDPRFPALSRNELDRIHIEVSVLSEPRPLAYADADDLLRKLRPGIDGVIIRKGFAAATFLPQVWEQLPDKEEFLEHLCMKAGLSPNAWKKGGLEVQTYQVQYFEEAQ